MSPAARRVLRRGSADDPAGRYALWLAPDGRRAAELLNDPAPPGRVAEAWRSAYGALAARLPPLHALMHVEAQTRLVDFINLEVDRLSMAHSVEARAPFLDYRLWEFCAALPPELKLARGREKALLRRALAGVLPRAVTGRRKQGLAVPYGRWLARPRLAEFAEQALAPDALRRAGYFVPAPVAALRAAVARGAGRDAQSLLMGVLSVQVWHAVFVARGGI
jgi:asparagine synthase (glutamine-hydrolysing)